MPTLSEAESKRRLAEYGIPFAPEITAASGPEAVSAASAYGIDYPVVAKLSGDRIAHKSERGLVRLGLADADALASACSELLAMAKPDDGEVEVLVAPMLSGKRELIAGLVRDAQFGLCVMLGVGGVLAEAVADVAFRLSPLTPTDAYELIEDLRTAALLDAFRGEPAVDREALADVIIALSRFGDEQDGVVSVDLNPLIVVSGRPIAVDALVEIE